MYAKALTIGCDELRRDRDRLQLLFEVSGAIALHGDLDTLLEDLGRRLPAIVDCDYVAVELPSGEGNLRAHILAGAELASASPESDVPPEGSGSSFVFHTQQPIVVTGLAERERAASTVRAFARSGITSFCTFPLTTADRRHGVMTFGWRMAGAFAEVELEFLQQVAQQVGLAVDNALNVEAAQHSREELARERDQFRLLLEVADSIASHRDLEALFRDLAARLPVVVPFDYINLLLHDAARNLMRLHILVAPEESTVKAGLELPVDASIAGHVWETQQPVIIEDLATDPRFPMVTAMLRANGVQSLCTVPLTTALRRLGTLGFGSLTRRLYRPEDVRFMEQVAAQVAVAVDNVLHDESARAAQDQLTRERDRLKLLLEVNNAVVSHLDLDDVFRAVSTCLRKVIRHDGSCLLFFHPETHRYRLHTLRFDSDGSSIEEGRTDGEHCVKSPVGLIAYSSRKPALFREEDLRELAGTQESAARLLAEGVRTFCCLPLLSHDRVLGTLNLGSIEHDAFSPADLELLEQVAQQVAIGVENGLAFREIGELKEKLNKEKLYLEDEIRTERNFEEIVGRSSALKQALKQIEIVAPTDSTVLIQGETGTGKELIARAIHNLSGRRNRTFVKLNCAAIPTGLLESELFGHEKGAFTGAISQKIGRLELANGGTLFLDEVGDIPLELQSKFLRVLQEQEFERLGSTRTVKVDTRLVAATNRDLAAMVEEKQFRSDLYYRLNVFPIVSPPLRDRQEDIEPLVRYFTRKFARRMNKRIDTISTETLAVLSRYHWPGNIRELENFIERAVILSRGPNLQAPLAELKQQSRASRESTAAPRALATLADAEREHIRQALDAAHWRLGGPAGAAARLGMKRTTLQSKMARLGIERPSAG